MKTPPPRNRTPPLFGNEGEPDSGGEGDLDLCSTYSSDRQTEAKDEFVSDVLSRTVSTGGGTSRNFPSPFWMRISGLRLPLNRRVLWTIFVFLLVAVIILMVPTRSENSQGSNGPDKHLQGGFQSESNEASSPPLPTAPTLSPIFLGEATFSPTSEPVVEVTANPTSGPTFHATGLPTSHPTLTPNAEPTQSPTKVTFNPGELTVRENGLLLSTGLTSRILAVSGSRIPYDTGGQSSQTFQRLPDFGACFEDPNNAGGWVYMSNSEVREYGQGGVGAFTFNKHGQLVNYQYALTGTSANCGGGRTPWGAYISCEEFANGQNWQLDPTGERPPQVITLGSDGGFFESFAYDVRDKQNPAFFVTEDAQDGALQRFRPDSPDWNDPWNILLGEGTTDFLVLDPNDDWTGGTFEWTNDRQRARESAARDYPNAEGIDVHEGQLYFISKRYSTMYTLDLDTFEFKIESTREGLFNGGPDQIKRILNDDVSNLLFFTEDGGDRAGVHARNDLGSYLTVLESSEYENETTGLSFSPDGKAMYVAYQVDGLLFEIRREDGLPFQGRSLNVAYHASAGVERE